MSSWLRSAWERLKDWDEKPGLDFEQFWLAPVSAAPLALMRVGMGATMLAAYLLYAPDLERLLGSDGFARYLVEGEYFSRDHLWLVWWTIILSSLAFSLGFLTKVSGMLLIGGHLLLIEQTRLFSWGWVPTVPAFLAYLTLGPSQRVYSIDAILFGGSISRWRDLEVPAWSLRLIQVHIVAIYLGAGWHRIDDDAWWRGEMVYDALTYAYFSRFPTVDWGNFKLLLALANWAAWSVELFAPLGLLWKRTRLGFALGLAGMHLGLELTSTIGWWQFMMIVLLFAYYPEPWSKRILEVLWRPALRRQKRPEAVP